MWRAGAMAVGLAVVACGPPPVFTCQTDQSCGEQGRCEAIGYCSFPDADCASGRRYGALASGELANACVGNDEGTGEASTMPMETTLSISEGGSTTALLTTSGVTTTSGSSSSSESSSTAESSASSGGTLDQGLILHLPLDDELHHGERRARCVGQRSACAVRPVPRECARARGAGGGLRDGCRARGERRSAAASDGRVQPVAVGARCRSGLHAQPISRGQGAHRRGITSLACGTVR